MNYIITLLFLLLQTLSIASPPDSSLTYQAQIHSFISQHPDYSPHWFIHNRNGIFVPGENNLLALGRLNYLKEFGKHWKLDAGLTGVANINFDQSYIHEAFINLSYGPLQLKIGQEELVYMQNSEEISSGAYFFSNNARPIPRIGMGFYEYTDVPFTNGYIQIKGFLNQGFLYDDRGARGTSDVLLHEKSLYLRSNNLLINPHVGINHSALFGGSLNGKNIPVDYISTFFGSGSDKVGEDFSSEVLNAAGAHSLLFDIGFNFTINDQLEIQTFFQKPVTDLSGMWGFFQRNRDHILGIVVKTKNSKLIQEFTYENISTMWQSGPGAFDPVINDIWYVGGKGINNYDSMMLATYGIETNNIAEDDFWEYVKRVENYGFEYGGRDNFYNNGLYYRGWSYNELAMGNSLFLTQQRVKAINPDFNGQYDYFFVNTRMQAHHIGVKGEFSPKLQYRFLFTHSDNFGTYQGLNKGVYQWESAEPFSDYEYYFEGGLAQNHLFFEAQYLLKSNLSGTLALAYDVGDMYKNYGIQLGLNYSGFLLDK